MSRVLISSSLVSQTEDADAVAALRADGHELTFRQDLVGKGEVEPLPPDSPVRATEKAILSAHVAGISYESTRRAARMACENLRRVLGGERPLSIVNPQVLAE